MSKTVFRKGWIRALKNSSLPAGSRLTAVAEAKRQKRLSPSKKRIYQISYAKGIRAFWRRQLIKQQGRRDVSVIIPALNEALTIDKVLREIKRLKPLEIIVVCNGTTDRTALIAASHGCKVISYEQPLGHDIGRSVGAAEAKGSTLLFLDGDISVYAEDLLPFIRSIEKGADLALNYIDPLLPPSAKRDTISTMKEWLNSSLQRPELGTASMTAIPHALRRSYLEVIGSESLSVPPKAQAMMIRAGAKTVLANCVDIIKTNRLREHNGSKGMPNVVEELIIGDHIEAVAWLQANSGVDDGNRSSEPYAFDLSSGSLNIEALPITSLSRSRWAELIQGAHPRTEEELAAADGLYLGGEAYVESSLPPLTVLPIELSLIINAGLETMSDQLVPLQTPTVVKASILDSLNKGQGFSLIRLGDGELLTLAQETVLSTEEVRNAGGHFLEYAGLNLPDLQVRDALATAVMHADVIGIPSKRSATFQGLFHRIAYYYSWPLHSMRFTSSIINYQLAEVTDLYPFLLNSYRTLLLGNRMHDLNILLAEQGFSQIQGNIGVNGAASIDSVCEKTNSYNFDVTLISAGIAAPLICNRLREQGKIAIDFGHMADELIRGAIRL
ncbi:glycosyltransferase [Paenibacillus sp. SYP-B3998]|uniref:4,4'-diaponeurosporenoate glycosyltransferase n=1 Tax=Paenibacillus sp. SYP-B3998 TaxID=2678564 RepID=A0A6G3ZQM7_9BACL|nr:GT-D fold domain-containing glycosyltransferase [Paenibacillus sp. SYP-B3998]NEW04425.1 glycosyltransferase [Paenibacillus sp. SYP-B3998]